MEKETGLEEASTLPEEEEELGEASVPPDEERLGGFLEEDKGLENALAPLKEEGRLDEI